MTIEDQLSHDERIHLEALNQSVQRAAFLTYQATDDDTLKRAKRFEHYIRTGDTNEPESGNMGPRPGELHTTFSERPKPGEFGGS